MRILHVFDHSLPFHSGYVIRSLAILGEQRKLGWETVHLTNPKHFLMVAGGYGKTSWNRQQGYPLKETVDGWEFYRTTPPSGLMSRLPGIKAFPIVAATAERLKQVIRRKRPDVLHAHSPFHNGLAAYRAAKQAGIPFVYEIRAFWEDAHVGNKNDRFGKIEYWFWRAMEDYVIRKADAVTVICEGLRDELLERGVPADKVSVIPNAVDPSAFVLVEQRDEELEDRLGLKDLVVLGFAGSFLEYEGLHLLVESMRAIRNSESNVKLVLVGKGPAEDGLRELAEQVGVSDNIVFTGQVPFNEVNRYYSLFDILVYPRESMRLTELVTPLKPLEAMAQGKIVMASSVGGHRELITDGVNGYLFAPDSPNAIAEKVMEVIRSREGWPELKARARAYVETERNWAASVSGYRKIYGQLTGRSLS